MKTAEFIFNHDGYGILDDLYDTDRSERAAADLLVRPLAEAGLTSVEWGLSSTVLHNCRIRGGRPHSPALWEQLFAEVPKLRNNPERRRIPEIVVHYNRQPRDLLDIVVHHGHEQGLEVFAALRLNHALGPLWLEGAPGVRHNNGTRIDFRDESFHAYLEDIFAAILERGVDGIALDFERKAPFFPNAAPLDERVQAATRFVERMRRLTDKPIRARVCHDAEIGTAQGQDPEGWLRAGLLDSVVPATHNHEPDLLDWRFDRFVEAAKASPRRARVCPQIWPTPEHWQQAQCRLHSDNAVRMRIGDILAMGAHGVYFFNFCCFWPRHAETVPFAGLFNGLGRERQGA